MKHAAIFLTITMLLICFTANAQKSDSVFASKIIIGEKNDTIFLKTMIDGKITDTFFVNKKLTFDTKDTLLFTGQSSVNVLTDGAYVFRKDSLGKSGVYIAHQKDSSRKKIIYQRYSARDSVFVKTKGGFVRLDSLKRMDKLYKIQNKEYKYYQKSYDSLNRGKQDSVRFSGQLNRLQSNLQQIKEDFMIRNNKLNKKEISIEVNCSKNGTVIIKNLSRKIIVKTFNEKKVKIVTTVFAEQGFESKDIDWDKEVNLGIDQAKDIVTIRPAEIKTMRATSTEGGTITLAYTNASTVYAGNVSESKLYTANKRSEVTIYIPAGAKLKMENRYNDVSILNNLSDLNADLMNVNLKMLGADKAVIKLRYGSAKAGDIKDADLNLVNCKFTSGDIDKLIIDSKYSTVTFQNSGVIDMTSVSDQYTIAQAGVLTVSKNFGELNIGDLKSSIELTGSSADVSINKIYASVKTIKINNKYADVKLPMQQLNNYTLQFAGNYSKVFTPFEMETGTNSAKKANVNFSKTVGNVKKDFTAFDVSCASCSVDFR